MPRGRRLPPPSSGAAAATGDEIDLDGIQLNQPAGWQPAKLIGTGSAAVAPVQAIVMAVSVMTAIDPGESLMAFARGLRAATLYATKEKLADEVTVAGQPWFHLSGGTSPMQYSDEFGTTVGDQHFVITIDTRLTVDRPSVRPRSTRSWPALSSNHDPITAPSHRAHLPRRVGARARRVR